VEAVIRVLRKNKTC